MDPFKEEEIEKEVKKTIKRLADKDEKDIPFTNWPKIERNLYELEPKRRNSGLGWH